MEAVLISSSTERIDVQDAIAELEQSSLVELSESDLDGTRYVSVPLVAHVFGGRKLAVSPVKTKIEVDRDMLMTFGPMQESDVRYGLQPRVQRLIQNLAKRAERGQDVAKYEDVLTFLGRRFPPAWLNIASLYAEQGDTKAAIKALEQYLENPESDDNRRKAWEQLANLSRRSNGYARELHALVEAAEVPDTWFGKLSEIAHRVNEILNENRDIMDKEEKEQLVSRLITLMQGRMSEATPIAHSRVAWLMLNINDSENAKDVVKSGLLKDPADFHCNKLARRLEI